jgi:hypothetical protein
MRSPHGCTLASDWATMCRMADCNLTSEDWARHMGHVLLFSLHSCQHVTHVEWPQLNTHGSAINSRQITHVRESMSLRDVSAGMVVSGVDTLRRKNFMKL